MEGELRFRKALMQADRGDRQAAKATLRGLLGEVAASALRVRALVVLGDLLASDGDRGPARQVLGEAIALGESLDETDDLVDHEIARAHEVLGHLEHLT